MWVSFRERHTVFLFFLFFFLAARKDTSSVPQITWFTFGAPLTTTRWTSLMRCPGRMTDKARWIQWAVLGVDGQMSNESGNKKVFGVTVNLQSSHLLLQNLLCVVQCYCYCIRSRTKVLPKSNSRHPWKSVPRGFVLLPFGAWHLFMGNC